MASQSSLLPPDEVIYERSKTWANLMARIIQEENFDSMLLEDIPSPEDVEHEDSDLELSEKSSGDGCRALIKTSKFESECSSDEFDVNNLLSETLPIVEERKRKWRESGMDKVLDTFDINAITNKVGSWLQRSKFDKSLATNTSYEDTHVVHFEDHQMHLNSDDSFHSADTAKYILSNRKQRSNRYTTMTIKRFRYVEKRRKQLQGDHHFLYNLRLHKDFDKVFNKNCCEYCLMKDQNPLDIKQDVHHSRFDNVLKPTDPHSTEQVTARNLRRRRRVSQRKRFSEVLRKRSSSSSSSSSPSPIQNLKSIRKMPRDLKWNECSKNDHDVPSLKKKIAFSKKADTHERDKKNQNDSIYENNTESVCFLTEKPSATASHDASKQNPQQIPTETNSKDYLKVNADNFRELDPKNDLAFNKVSHNIKLKTNVNQENEKNKRDNEPSDSELTCFIPDNIVNSTARVLLEVNKRNPSRQCRLSPIKDQSLRKTAKLQVRLRKCSKQKVLEKEEITSPINNSCHKIVIYTPKERTLHSNNISGNTFILTQEHLRKSIGNKAARRYITFNANNFPLKFNASNAVYFKKPVKEQNASTSSDSEEEDVLEILGKQGEIVEEHI